VFVVSKYLGYGTYYHAGETKERENNIV